MRSRSAGFLRSFHPYLTKMDASSPPVLRRMGASNTTGFVTETLKTNSQTNVGKIVTELMGFCSWLMDKHSLLIVIAETMKDLSSVDWFVRP